MRLVCGTCSAVYDASFAGEPRCGACTVRSSGTVETEPAHSLSGSSQERWFVRTERGQAGPFAAAQLSRQLEQGELSWTSDVWREGLGGFKAARRDQLLVLAVAGVRGLDSATMRVDSLPSLLHSSNHLSELDLEGEGGEEDAEDEQEILLESHEHLLEETDQSLLIEEEPDAPQAFGSSPPMPAVPRTLLELLPAVPHEARASDSPPALTITPSPSSTLPVTPSRSSLPSRRSPRAGRALAVALLAFVSGAIVAVGPTRISRLASALRNGSVSSQPLPSSSVATGALSSAALAAVPSSPTSAQPRQAAPTQPVALKLARSSRASEGAPRQAAPEEVSAAFKQSAATVLRCLPDAERSLSLGLVLEGSTGRVQKVHVKSPRLRAGARECVKEAFVDFHVTPFREARQQLKYRYTW